MFEEERKVINEIDEEIKNLFLKRQETVLKIAKIKYANNLAIFDAKREEDMKKRLTNDLNEEDKKYYLSLLDKILELSKSYQKEKIDEMK